MEELRKQILLYLEKHSRVDLGELAVLLGTDEVTVANEISAMERAKIICGYHTLIDWDKTGTEYVNALIEVKVTDGERKIILVTENGMSICFDEKDIRIDVMRASGNGGQCVNTTDSAVRLTHYPTGIVIYSQTEKSQLQNKEKAFRLLRSKLYELELEKQQSAEAEARRSQIGTGDRSEKIRTYNFPQGRVTEHRIKLTLYKIDNIMNGDLDEIIDSLIAADQAAKLANMNE